MSIHIARKWNCLLSVLFVVGCSSSAGTGVDMAGGDGGRSMTCAACAAGEVCSAGSCLKIPASCPCPTDTYCDLATNSCKAGCASDVNCSAGACCDPDTRSCTTSCVDTSACRGTSAPGKTYKLAINHIKIPNKSASFAFDYDGDGRTENQLVNVANLLNLSGFVTLQANIDSAIAAGSGIPLLSFTTSSPVTSTCVGVAANSVKPYTSGTPAPRFDGSDVFTPATTAAAALQGQLQSGTLSTTAPAMQAAADEQRLQLQLALGKTSFTLALRGVQITGVVSKLGSGYQILDGGAIHGVISATELNGKLLPFIATYATQLINSDPTSSTAKALIGIFETGTGASTDKCKVATKCCRTNPATCVILPAEVTASPLGGVIAPDVQVLDTADRWVPVPGGRAVNAMSFGFGFTAVSASY